jgi:Fe-S-cluster containining protein
MKMPHDISSRDLPAGEFSGWLRGMRSALRDKRGSDVPCDGCTACCRSSQFVHIGPAETETLSRIPRALLYPAPRMPIGHVVLGYDEHGRCPLLVDDGCSIYEHRPQTCRTYDCRIFPAAGVEVVEEDKALIAQRSGRWQFDYPTERDRREHDAVQAAATFIREHEDLLPEASAPANSTQLAVLAIEFSDAFVRHETDSHRATVAGPDAGCKTPNPA